MPSNVGLTPTEVLRYSRHLVLPEVGPEGQLRLKNSSALVVGAGGLGIPAAIYLVSAGVGRVGIADSDLINMPNLQRQFLFTETDLGRPKVDVAKAKLAQTNPNVTVVTHARLDATNAMNVIGEYDVVLDATDNVPSRYLINDACVLQDKPDVYAGVIGFNGQASVFHASRGPCYRCLFSQPPPPNSVKSCEEAGVLNVIPGIMGTIQANQAIGIILGKGTPLIGRLLVFNGLDNTFDEVKFRKSSTCAVCGTNPTITELIDYEEFCGTKQKEGLRDVDMTPIELKAAIDAGRKPILLDVREPFEYALCHLESSTLIPVDQLSLHLKELDLNDEIVVYCHIGIRSAGAVSLLRKNGFTKVKNLTGGIDAWAVQVDPEMPRY